MFPTLRQVMNRASKKASPLHSYPLTKAEELKINSRLKSGTQLLQVDNRQSFERILEIFDSIFGKFIQPIDKDVVFRGKLEYKNKFIDPKTGEKQVVYTISNPKSLYRMVDSDNYFIRVPEKSNLISGFYAQVTVRSKLQNNPNIFFVEPNDLLPINFEANIPTLFLDYQKFNDVFKLDYGFDMSETSQKYKRNLQLTNLDLMLMTKIAGENFHDDIRGGMNGNIIKTTNDQSTYNLEVIDNFLDTITISNNKKTVFNRNLIHCGTLEDFDTTLNKNNRSIKLSQYKNFYGGNIGFSLRKTLHLEEDQFIRKLNHSSIDYLNPVSNIVTRSNSAVKNLLKLNKEHVFSSQILFLETQLLPIKSKISEIELIDPKVLRITTMLKKFEECIDDLGTDEILPKLNISDTDIIEGDNFLKENKKEVEEFITHK